METQQSLPPHHHLRLCHTGLPYSSHGVCSMESTCRGSSEWQALTAGTHTMSPQQRWEQITKMSSRPEGHWKSSVAHPCADAHLKTLLLGFGAGGGAGWGRRGELAWLSKHVQTPLVTTSWDTRVQEGSLLLRLIARGSPTLPHHSLSPIGLS